MTFLHTNFKPKWDLRLSDDMRRYTRRWVVLQPGNRTFLDDAFLDLQGRDPEMEVGSPQLPPLSSQHCSCQHDC